jgi:hypothetical protein
MGLKITARTGIAYCEKCADAATAMSSYIFNKEIRNILNLQSHVNVEYLLTESILHAGK